MLSKLHCFTTSSKTLAEGMSAKINLAGYLLHFFKKVAAQVFILEEEHILCIFVLPPSQDVVEPEIITRSGESKCTHAVMEVRHSNIFGGTSNVDVLNMGIVWDSHSELIGHMWLFR